MVNWFHFHTFADTIGFSDLSLGDDWFWQQGQWNCKHTEDWNDDS